MAFLRSFMLSSLKELHQSHPGFVRMKAIARSYFWWPCLDQDIEAPVKGCTPCQEQKPAPPVVGG